MQGGHVTAEYSGWRDCDMFAAPVQGWGKRLGMRLLLCSLWSGGLP
jgi:hypothetical protein